MSALRPYQIDAVEGIRRALGANRSTLLVMATGTGKTRVISEVTQRWLAARPGERVLALAHRKELIDQLGTRIPVTVGIEARGMRSSGQPLVVASIQTMVRRLGDFEPDAFDLVVIDEAHLSAARTYQRILEHFDGARVLGVTATPDRLDGRPLGDTFKSVAFRYPIDRAIREGYLCPIRARRVTVNGLQLDSVRTTRGKGDFSERDLSKAMREESPLHSVVRPLLEQAGDRPTVVFAVDVAHGRALADVINRYRPGAAAMVHGTDRLRDIKVRDFQRRGFQFLVNCEILTTGWDAPLVACVAMARPTQSRALYAQCVGRGTRLAPGKEDLLVLDFVGATTQHRLIGPADVLAGEKVDPDVRAAAAQLREEYDLGELDILEMARAFAEEQRAVAAQQARVLAVVRYFATQIDPFLGTTLAPAAKPGQLALDIDAPMSERQRRRLRGLGAEQVPESMTSAAAARLIDALVARKKSGLCSLKAARRLAKRVPDATALTHIQAQKIFAYLRRAGWNRRIPARLYQ